MDKLTHPHPSRHDATTESHTNAYTASLCQRIQQSRLTSMLMGHIGLVLVIGSHLLLCSSCNNAPMQLGMDGEEPSTSGNAGEVVDSDSDEEAVAYRQELETKIKETKQQIDATNDRIRTLESEKAKDRYSSMVTSKCSDIERRLKDRCSGIERRLELISQFKSWDTFQCSSRKGSPPYRWKGKPYWCRTPPGKRSQWSPGQDPTPPGKGAHCSPVRPEWRRSM